MKRSLNNKENRTLADIKREGYAYEIVEMFNYKGEAEYYANANGWCISLNSPGQEWKIKTNKYESAQNISGNKANAATAGKAQNS